MDSFSSLNISSPHNSKDNITDTIKSLYGREYFTDVKFRVITVEGEKIYHGHKILLAMWSPILSKMFYSKNEIVVNNVSKIGFECFFRFVYGCLETINWSIAIQTHSVAKLYKVSALEKYCLGILKRTTITTENAIPLLEHTEDLKLTWMKQRCLRIIQDNTVRVLSSAAFPNCSQSTIMTILQMEKLNIECEHEFFQYIRSWAKNKYITSENVSSVRDVMEPFLPHLNMLALSCAQFASIVDNSPELFTPEEALSIFMNISMKSTRMELPVWCTRNLPSRLK